MGEQANRRKEGLLEKTSTWFDLPADILAGLPRLEMTGDRELHLENYRGILSYSREELHLDGGKWVLMVRGRDLEIRVMREKELLIVGWIDSMELV